MIRSAKKLSNLKNIKEWKKIKKNLMTGCQPKQKADSEIENPSISTESESAAIGIINIIKHTTMMIIHLQKQCKDINSIFSIQISRTSRKHHNTT